MQNEPEALATDRSQGQYESPCLPLSMSPCLSCLLCTPSVGSKCERCLFTAHEWEENGTMRFTNLLGIVLAAWAINFPSLAQAQTNRELKVHMAQANNDSPYSFVRAKFNPGEVADPWAVRFFDEKNAEVPYFVWDSVTWKVAREGRADWGNRYALINHAPGNEPSVIDARSQKLQAAKKSLPDLGTRLEAE